MRISELINKLTVLEQAAGADIEVKVLDTTNNIYTNVSTAMLDDFNNLIIRTIEVLPPEECQGEELIEEEIDNFYRGIRVSSFFQKD